jgi:AcrR family transcriptional regulator
VPANSVKNASAPPPASSPEARILLATVECIERYGVTGATVRRITEAAGVNIAAINYYFGSKEALLEAALAQTLHEALPKALEEATAMVAKHRGKVEAGIGEFFRGHLLNAFSYPRISVAHLRGALLDQDYSGPAVTTAREFMEGFYQLVSPAMLQRTELERRLAVLQIWATIFNLALLPQLFGVPRESLTGEEMVKRLCATLFEAL